VGVGWGWEWDGCWLCHAERPCRSWSRLSTLGDGQREREDRYWIRAMSDGIRMGDYHYYDQVLFIVKTAKACVRIYPSAVARCPDALLWGWPWKDLI
jgi:hypothetical protein